MITVKKFKDEVLKVLYIFNISSLVKLHKSFPSLISKVCALLNCFNKNPSSGERLTIDDVPKCSKLVDGEWIDTTSDIDFETLWGIQTEEDLK